MTIVAAVMLLVVVVITALSSLSDIRSLRIPNVYSLIVIGCFIPAWLAQPETFTPLWHHFAAMGILFGLTYGMFCKGMMGGGDSKYGTALGLWIGLKGLMPFLFYMALVGGILGAMSLWLRKKKPFVDPKPGSWVEQVQSGQNAVPYGVAISVGSWAAFFHTGLLHQQINEVFKIIP